MQIVWPHWVTLSKSCWKWCSQSYITEVPTLEISAWSCCQITLASRNPPTFPMLFVTKSFSSSCGEPPESKQSDMVQLSDSPLSFFLHYISLSNICRGQKKHIFDILAALDICSTNSESNLKPSCTAQQTDRRAAAAWVQVWQEVWAELTHWHCIHVLLGSHFLPPNYQIRTTLVI